MIIYKMRSKRNELEIITEILELVNDGYTAKSALMKNANLSFAILKKYADYLISKGYLEESEYGYKITPKGLRLLEKLKQVRELEVRLAVLISDLSKEL
jgi:predicted transcriptional regulator